MSGADRRLEAAERWLDQLVAMPTPSGTPLLHHQQVIAARLRDAGAGVHLPPRRDTRFRQSDRAFRR
ncbi:hypothetical protein [Acidimangrovimonas sediminis]|uniref:hypothetical protein n=1 Tax=Acidimangrovimonas sediminis TaxID=2056283 RepID=UPI0011AEC7EC|nr:hypothetical protein [Acidimangrovimonas sediminis]